METVVITGAAGKIGTAIRPLLRSDARHLRLLDVREPTAVDPGTETFQRVDVTRPEEVEPALRGASAVVHLAGIPVEAAWEDLSRANADGTRVVLEAAGRVGVRSVLLASSIHAVGLATVRDATTTRPLPPRPDSYYGVSKATTETLGALHADRSGLTVVAARICAFGPEPPRPGPLQATWLSPADTARLIEATVRPELRGYHLVWGLSADGADLLALPRGQGIGYLPVDRIGRPWSPPAGTALLGGDAADPRHAPGHPW